MNHSLFKILSYLLLTDQKSFGFNLNTCCSTQNSFRNGVCESEAKDSGNFQIGLSVFEKLLVSNLSQAEIQDYLVRIRLSVFKINCTKTNAIEIPIASNDLDVKILQNGSFKFREKLYSPLEFCIDGVTEQNVRIMVCEAIETSETGSILRLPKCCDNGQLLDVSTKPGCVTTNQSNDWLPTLYQDISIPISVDRNQTRLDFYNYPPRNWCTGGGILMFQTDFGPHSKSPFRILQNGQVVYQVRNQWPTLSPDSYCVDGLVPIIMDDENFTEIQDVIFHCSPAPSDIDGVEHEPSNMITYFHVLIYGCFISAFFVLLTIAVYVLLWENQNIHGWTLLGSFVSLFFMYILIGTMHLYHLYWGVTIPRNVSVCWSIGIALHFFYLSTFTWMTAVNFDLWLTFSNLRPTASHARKGLKRFGLYVLFALGVPVTILSVSVVLDYLYRNNVFMDLILPDPNYASEQCFLARNASLLVYQYGPVGILLFVNIVFVVITILSVHKVQKTTSFVHSNSSNRHKQSFRLFGKLFVIMGFSWAFELISFFCSPNSVPWYWAIFDVINVCHGILIFIIFVCKRSTVKSLSQKYVCFQKLVEAVSRCMASAQVIQAKTNINRSFTNTFSLSRFTTRQTDSNRKSSDLTEMSTVSNAV